MPFSRRMFIDRTARTALAASIVSSPPLKILSHHCAEPKPPIEDPRLKGLIEASLDMASSSGASYADVRLTHTFELDVGLETYRESESITIGVRALVNGYWGFASSPIWNTEEASRLGREATIQAKSGGTGRPREMSLAPLSSVAKGHWTMPVRDDPFQMDRAEIHDFMMGLVIFLNGTKRIRNPGGRCAFVKQEKAFGSSEGAYFTQRTYQSSGSVQFDVLGYGPQPMRVVLDCLTPKGVGFELFRDQPLREICMREIEQTEEDSRLPLKPVDVGRFDAALGAFEVARLISQSIGAATELDRALGFEANAGGTSFITEPADMIGTLKLGNSALHITGNRSDPGGAATVRWDDEGVSPMDFTLVDKGILTSMQTNREGAAWLTSNTSALSDSVRSLGCAAAPDAIFSPVPHSTNLALSPADTNKDWEDLIEDLGTGIAMRRAVFDLDFQRMSGFGATASGGRIYEIKDGKRTALLPTLGVLFRTQELWNSLIDKGGVSETFGVESRKGEPPQSLYHSVTAVPALFKELTVIDARRKA